MPDAVNLTYPFGGLNDSQPDEVPLPGTSRVIRNMRTRDVSDGGKRRGCMRGGNERFIDSRVGGDSRVQDIVSMPTFENVGGTVLGDLLYTDNFNRDVAEPGLGDFDGGGDDYVLKQGTGATYTGSTGLRVDTAHWDSAYSGTTGLRVVAATGAYDGRDYAGGGSPSSGVISAAYFTADTGTVPTDNFAVRLTVQMASTLSSSSRGLLGLFCCGLNSAVTAGATDSALFVGFAFDDSAAGKRLRPIVFVNNKTAIGTGTYDDALLYENQYFGDALNTPLVGSEVFVIEMRKCGKRVDLLIDGQVATVIPDISARVRPLFGSAVWAASPVDTTRTQFGFAGYNIKPSATNSVFQYIDKLEVYRASVTSPMTSRKVVAAGGTKVCVGTPADGWAEATYDTGVDSIAADADIFLVPGPGPETGGTSRYVYILDGLSYKKVSLTSAPVVSAWAASTGDLPENSSDAAQKARYGLRWRNRVGLYGLLTDPCNYWFTRSGDADNMNLTPVDPDGLEAVSGDTSGTGLAWNPITCMAPLTSDVCLIGMSGGLAALMGDPALNGTMENVSESIGIVGPRAWAMDDRGNLYFVAYAGLYVIPAGRRDPEPLSIGRMDGFFGGINHLSSKVMLRWNQRLRGLHIFVEPSSESFIEHLFWDREENKFVSIDTFPTAHGPTASCSFTSEDGSDVILLGGWDGIVRQADGASYKDDDEAIDAAVRYGPFVAGTVGRATISRIQLRLGRGTDAALVRAYAAASSGDLPLATPKGKGRLIEGRQLVTINDRVGGGAVEFELASVPGRGLSIEHVSMLIDGGGSSAPGRRRA